MDWITTWDFSILDWIQAHLRCGAADQFFSTITHLADGGVFWILLAVVLLVIPKTRRFGLALALALVLDGIFCNGLLKPLIARARPYQLHPGVQLLIAPPSDYSFPSGHAAVSFTAAAALGASHAQAWGWSLALAILLALSRLYLYVHYPTDILAGALVGTLAGLAGAALAKRLPPRRAKKEQLDGAD